MRFWAELDNIILDTYQNSHLHHFLYFALGTFLNMRFCVELDNINTRYISTFRITISILSPILH